MRSPRHLPKAYPKSRRRGLVRYVIAAALIIGIAAFPVFSANHFYQNFIILALVGAVGATGLNMISGYAGYTSLGHGAFLGIGTYTAAVLTQHVHVSPFVWMPVSGLVASGCAAVLGVVAMRARGAGFAIVSLSLGAIALILAQNWTSLTNGNGGLYFPLPNTSVLFQNWPYHFAIAGTAAAAILTSWFVSHTRFGLGLMSIREDEDKAETIGINTRAYKVISFAVSAFFIGVAGAVYGYYISSVVPLAAFGLIVSVQFVIAMLLGGAGTLWGPVLGAFIVEFVNEYTNNNFGGAGNVRLAVFGGLLVLVVLFLPQGILPSGSILLQRWTNRGGTAEVGTRLEPIGKLPSFVAAFAAGEVQSATSPQASTPILEVRDIEKRFGGLQVLSNCGFTVPRGSVTGLIGPNGSGKTTLFNVVDGSMSCEGGDVLLGGSIVTRSQPWARSHAGLGRTFQITRLFRNLTVLENLLAPAGKTTVNSLVARSDSGREVERARELLEFVGLARYATTRSSDLSYGQQRLVELAQVLMMRPKLILLDEPCAGINPTLIERMKLMIRSLNAEGISFLLVEHNMPFVMSLCDKIVVLANGKRLAEGTPNEVQNDRLVLDAYLGHDFDQAASAGEVQ